MKLGEGGGSCLTSEMCDFMRCLVHKSVFLVKCLNIFATGCLSASYLSSRNARLLNREKGGALFAPKEVVITNSISFP